MTQPDNPMSRLPKRQDESTSRMRSILAAGKGDSDSPGTPPVQPEPQPAPVSDAASAPKSIRSRREPVSTETKTSVISKETLLPAFWTIASAISLTVNIILLAVIVILLSKLSEIQTTALSTGGGLLGGLYDNFELMDDAHIRTVIPVDAQVPVNFDLQLNSQTAVVLSQDVTVRGAYVVINTPLIDINAPANVTLPAGTSLPVNLALTVPVQTMIPIHLDVPVDIALSNTDLHTPFVGLRNLVKPFYCLMEPDALSVQGVPVCK